MRPTEALLFVRRARAISHIILDVGNVLHQPINSTIDNLVALLALNIVVIIQRN